MMKLFDMKQAPNPRRVRIYLAEKNLDVEQVQVDIGAGENLRPDYLAINPRGTMPALLLDNGTLIDESAAIIRYFEALHPEPSLLGRTPEEIGVIDAWDRRMEFDGMASITLAFRHSSPNFPERATPDARFATTQIPAMAERGLELARIWLDNLEKRLATSPWVAGERFSIADITAYVCLDFAKWVRLRADDSHPHVQEFHARMKARPSSDA